MRARSRAVAIAATALGRDRQSLLFAGWQPSASRADSFLRARRGLTLVDAAKQLGIGRDTLSDLEKGLRHPVFPTLAKIADGYDVPVEELLEAEELETAPLAPKS
jgi:DNA-binding XRE family transcriptional regulator